MAPPSSRPQGVGSQAVAAPAAALAAAALTPSAALAASASIPSMLGAAAPTADVAHTILTASALTEHDAAAGLPVSTGMWFYNNNMGLSAAEMGQPNPWVAGGPLGHGAANVSSAHGSTRAPGHGGANAPAAPGGAARKQQEAPSQARATSSGKRGRGEADAAGHQLAGAKGAKREPASHVAAAAQNASSANGHTSDSSNPESGTTAQTADAPADGGASEASGAELPEIKVRMVMKGGAQSKAPSGAKAAAAAPSRE